MKNKSLWIYYSSSIISYFIILLFGYMYIKLHHKQNERLRLLEVKNCCSDINGNYYLPCSKPKRNFIVKYLTGDFEADNIALNSLELMAKSLYDREETENGIKICFGDSVKYRSFVRLLDICKKNNIVHYLFFDDSFIFYFEYMDLELGDTVFKTKYIDRRTRLLKGKYSDYEIKIIPKEHEVDYLTIEL